nr:MAG TPA: hypothetical protein [Caudoviricetes sp.]
MWDSVTANLYQLHLTLYLAVQIPLHFQQRIYPTAQRVHYNPHL